MTPFAATALSLRLFRSLLNFITSPQISQIYSSLYYLVSLAGDAHLAAGLKEFPLVRDAASIARDDTCAYHDDFYIESNLLYEDSGVNAP